MKSFSNTIIGPDDLAELKTATELELAIHKALSKKRVDELSQTVLSLGLRINAVANELLFAKRLSLVTGIIILLGVAVRSWFKV